MPQPPITALLTALLCAGAMPAALAAPTPLQLAAIAAGGGNRSGDVHDTEAGASKKRDQAPPSRRRMAPAPASEMAPPPPPAAPAPGIAPAGPGAPDSPLLTRALEQLARAEQTLATAPRDRRGHVQQALQLTQRAAATLAAEPGQASTGAPQAGTGAGPVRSALRALEAARDALHHGPEGDRRVQALALVNAAIAELRQGLAAARD